jgi:outer membrane protein OmpA-like peptidoglycan-associated protein
MLLSLLTFLTAFAQDLAFGYTPSPKATENPALLITPARAVDELYVEIKVGTQTLTFTKKDLPAGVQQRFEWKRDTHITHADAFVRARFESGDVTEQQVPINYSYELPLKIDLSKAHADIDAHTITVQTTAAVTEADVIVYGERKSILSETTVPVSGGPGEVTIPFTGDASEVVLVEVKLKNATAWAGFTYSPWFLNIPHEDVLFDSNSAAIPPSEVWKLEATLKQLQEVVEKYGSVVPVKLYVAGCTDTMGDTEHNRDLSNRRAQAIAGWLKAQGFSYPIYYYGFGESLLAVSTGDSVDNSANRRVLYMVGANPPPSGSGIPGVTWKAL